MTKPNYVTRDITRDQFEELGLRWSGSAVVRDDIVDTTRWGIVHRVVFSLDGDLWQVEFEEPATEMQETDPFEYGDTIEARKVEARRVEVTEYHPVIAN